MPDNEPYGNRVCIRCSRSTTKLYCPDPYCGYETARCRDYESCTPEEAGRLERDRDPIQPRWVNGTPHDPDEIPSKDEL